MVGSLDNEHWNVYDIVSASTGFLLIGPIWWIYFDSFPKLERARRLTTGNVLIFTHLLVCMGLLILANMIRHAILGDIDRSTFALLAITGLCCFYPGSSSGRTTRTSFNSQCSEDALRAWPFNGLMHKIN
jgi:low temperature requirement protein LtrA